MRKVLFFFLAGIVVFGLLGSNALAQGKSGKDELSFQPVLTFDNQGKGPAVRQLIVQVRGPLDDYKLNKLGQYGAIQLTIERYNAVAIQPRGPQAERTLRSLPFVQSAEEDRPHWLTGFGTWDRDILDVVDMEETGSIGDPDAREVAETGAGVHVAVIDSGLIKVWRAFLDESKVRTDLARAFMGGGAVNGLDNISNPENLWERDTSSHGTAVASHIIGFKISGLVADGVAPDAKIIPLKVFPNGEAFAFTSHIAAAIAYVVGLKENEVIGPTVINMSLGGGAPSSFMRAAIGDAINHGVVVVASAGNAGENGMGWPGAFPEVISAGATGWAFQFLNGGGFWRTLDVPNDPDGTFDSEEAQSFVTTFSSRAVPARSVPFNVEPQELDVLAPGALTVAPCLLHGTPATPGNATFCFWFGTSFSSPLTAGVAALMLENDPGLTQADVESIMKSTALPMLGDDGRAVVPVATPNPTTWDTTCGSNPCDPVGAGLLQADAALAAIP